MFSRKKSSKRYLTQKNYVKRGRDGSSERQFNYRSDYGRCRQQHNDDIDYELVTTLYALGRKVGGQLQREALNVAKRYLNDYSASDYWKK